MQPPACRLQRLLLGSHSPRSTSICNHYLFIFGSQATRACSQERLVEPERESEEASVWAGRLDRRTRQRSRFPAEGVGDSAERPPSWKTCPHTRSSKNTERRRLSFVPFWCYSEGCGTGVLPRNLLTQTACPLAAKALLSGRKGSLCGETEETDTLGHPSLFPLPQPVSQLA